MVCPLPPASGRVPAFFRPTLLLACLVLASGCAPDTGFRIDGSVEELTATGEAMLVGTTSVPGEEQVLARGPVDNGRFALRGETPAPRQATVKVLAENGARDATDVIVEPGAELRVAYAGPPAGLTTEGGGPYHRQLVLSWRSSATYLDTLARYAEVMKQQRDSPEGAEQEALLQEASRLHGELRAIKTGALVALAAHQDPTTALLAIELGAFAASREVLNRLDKLMPQPAKDAVTQELVRQGVRIDSYLELVENDEALVAGVIAPDFAARSVAGEQLQLSEILAANKLVLVDFWASWCAPCIEQFPHLKDLHGQFHAQGFEIVGVSLDEAGEDWRQASADQELPWIDLGDQLAFTSPAAVEFGVTYLPKSYLLDTNGRVLARDLDPDTLQAELTERFTAAY